MSKKFATTIGAALVVLSAWLSGSLSTPDAIGAIGTLAVSYICVEGAVDIARARTFISVARGVLRVADKALEGAEKTIEQPKPAA